MPNDENDYRPGDVQEGDLDESANSYMCPKHRIRIPHGDECPLCLAEQSEE
jgi:hypothetical protein